ncbi:LAMI_0E03686g1_1 [Lachancea mirantina]|uniref:diphosphoinositol-polyphosphate diphosphatase n=1 Tax=Lachancea mirantina TaxID=1230905 RepID=A0A1G4JKD9_9SACH|nr:LAMI_0E03686g1_1 [Lachancea mirantina]
MPGRRKNIEQLMERNPDAIMRILEREEGILEIEMGSDTGMIDVHRMLKEDLHLQEEVSGALEKFYEPGHASNGGVVGHEEDVDDVYDADEHKAKTTEVRKNRETGGVVQEVVPPENFSHVVGEIYRSSFPRPENFDFLENRIKLKSILVLIPEDYPRENLEFMERAGIRLFQVGMSGNKEPFVNIPSDLITDALEVAMNPENHPILIHCNRGKHRTGCLVGCIRKLQNWSLTMIFDEYRRFAFPKARALDQQFIEMYDDNTIKGTAAKHRWIPISW